MAPKSAEQSRAPGITGFHDIGGLLSEFDGKLDLKDKVYSLWERNVHAILLVLAAKKLMSVDELRKGVEALPPAMEVAGYYGKWAAAIANACVERNLITKAELDAEMGIGEEQGSQDVLPPVLFKAGDVVRVRTEQTSIRWRKPHLRTPGYIHGVLGVIERECQGLFGNPEALAFREPAQKQPLYRVRFRMQDVWEGYGGGEGDTVDVEIYQPWLEPGTQEELESQHAAAAARHRQIFAAQQPEHHHHDEHEHDHHHEHEHGHGHHGHAHGHTHGHAHDHGDGSEPHVHEARVEVEAAAVAKEEAGGEEDTERRRLADALYGLLTRKGILTSSQVRETQERLDSLTLGGGGARVVARAWVDPAFKQRLLKDGSSAVQELGLSPSIYGTGPKPTQPQVPPPGTDGAGQENPGAQNPLCAPQPSTAPGPRTGLVLTVVENTPEVHNVVVCTLCSCYPLSILGLSPPWYKSRQYRARTVRDPRGVLAEFGTQLPPGTRIAVHDSTADNRYLVLPMRPAGTEGWSEEALAELVTRDCMIGVSLPLTPEQLAARKQGRQ